jgi:hypothetical protein
MAEGAANYRRESLQENTIYYIEIVVLVISDLIDRTSTDNHQVLQLLIVETAHHLFNINLLFVATILTLNQLVF